MYNILSSSTYGENEVNSKTLKKRLETLLKMLVEHMETYTSSNQYLEDGFTTKGLDLMKQQSRTMLRLYSEIEVYLHKLKGSLGHSTFKLALGVQDLTRNKIEAADQCIDNLNYIIPKIKNQDINGNPEANIKMFNKYLTEEREYLCKFLQSKKQVYHETSSDIGRTPRNQFEELTDIRDIWNNITGWLFDYLKELRIPEDFPSPQNFLEVISLIKSSLEKYQPFFENLYKKYEENVPYQISSTDEARREVIAALDFVLKMEEAQKYTGDATLALSSNFLVESILVRFGEFCRSLERRQRSKPQILVEDEYDVQDFLRSILRLHFNDVRSEEPNPSMAGASSKSDIFLKPEQIVIEVKFVKKQKGLTDKTLGEQFAVDLVRYKSHPEYKTLYFFTYDPNKILSNPNGLKSDFESHTTDSLKIVAIFGD